MIDSSEFDNFMQGCQDAKNGIPHESGKGENYDKGYSFEYSSQQCEEIE